MTTTTYNRLENRARSEDFSRALRAEVRDPLWMLSRQWQMGEFKAENTGSPIKSRVHTTIHPVQQFIANQAGEAHPISAQQPLEVFVERETVPMDLLMRMEMGRHFERLLKKHIPNENSFNQVMGRLLSTSAPVSLRLEMPAPGFGSRNLFADRRLRQAAAIFAAGDILDGGALYTYLQADPGHTFSQFFVQLPASATPAAVDAIGDEFVAWYRRTYSQPATPSEISYQEQRGEYAFYVSVPNADGSTTALHAPEYHHGSLDWYAFDIENEQQGMNAGFLNTDSTRIKDGTQTVVPTVGRFAGMPHSRWWQFEDGKVNLQAPRGGELNPAEVIFNDFALHFSNDWMVFPLTLPFGHLCDIDSVVVTDVFGQRSRVRPAGSDDATDYLRWDLFSLKQQAGTAGDYRLLLPPVLDRIQEGKPFEEVHLVRDEMANMVWAIEKTVGDGMGSGADGYETATAVRNYLLRFTETEAAPPNTGVKQYKLATTVPDNWIPFVPVRVADTRREIQLQRSSMPLVVGDEIEGRVLPRTGIISLPASPFYLHEEEVPRAGAILTRSWQRTRWYNGQTFSWVGRRKQTGRGEAASGLAFDVVE